MSRRLIVLIASALLAGQRRKLRAVEADHADAAASFDDDGLGAHGRSSGRDAGRAEDLDRTGGGRGRADPDAEDGPGRGQPRAAAPARTVAPPARCLHGFGAADGPYVDDAGFAAKIASAYKARAFEAAVGGTA